MNLRQPYEQLIADKLRHLPAPDAAASWQQMKRMLDDDEDTRGGGRKRPPGNGWWRIGIIAVVLSAGFWLYERPAAQLTKNSTAVTAQTNGNTSAEKSNSNKTQTSTIDNTTTLDNTTALKDNSNSTAASGSAIGNNPATSNGNTSTALKGAGSTSATNNASLAAKNKGSNTATKSTNDKLIAATVSAIPAPVENSTANAITGANTTGHNKTRITTGTHFNLQVNGSGTNGSNTSNKYKPAAGHHTGKYSPFNGISNTPDEEVNNAFVASSNNNNIAAGANNFDNVPSDGAKEKTWLERLTGLTLTNPAPFYNTSLSAGDSLQNNRDVTNLLNNETKKSVAKALRDKEIAALDKKDKKFHLDLSNLFKPFSMRVDNDPWWAAGLVVNGTVPVGAQNRYNYNMNAKSGTLSDYIPSPYLQYHLNDYVYFQTELNFVSPQYTPQLLLYRSTSDITAASVPPGPVMSQQKSIYVQKMYYFNWPVSLHYSPIKNLFFSAGIQFSSFQSGIAAVEEKKYETLLGPEHASTTTTVLKFKDDSIAAKIAPNEWRWQAGAEYYMNRFSVGLRYNQSFKKSINTIVTPGLAPTVNRNESLLFFVRYNLFESRNKKSEGDKN